MRREIGNNIRSIVIVAVIAGLLYPVISSIMPGWEVMLTYGIILAIAALGFNLLFNYTGLLSFGHAAFVGLGAYAVGLSVKYIGLRILEVQVLIGVLLSALLALIVGFIAVRYRGIFFAILMLVTAQILWGFYVKFYHITGGTDGIRIPRPTLFFIYDTTGLGYHAFNMVYHYYALLWFTVLAIIMWYIVNSPFGYTLRVIKDAETRAVALGVNVNRYRLLALVISAIYAGIAGALYAPINRLVTPDLAYWTLSGKIVFMSILGGTMYFLGPIIGALTYVYLETIAQRITIHWYLILGITIIAIMFFMPRGLLGLTELEGFKKMARLFSALRLQFKF
ncbi:MAG: branched-chain amino acid ABC transporter permease [Acidilobaceae archaeon]